MNPEDKAEFDRITGLSANELSDAEKDVLRARSSYLSEEQKHAFADVLRVTEDATDEVKPLTGPEIKEQLTARGIEFKSNAKVADLQALLDEAFAKENAENQE